MTLASRRALARRVRREVTHDRRPEGMGPVHVVLKLKRGLPGLRTPRALRVLEHAFREAQRADFSIAEFSILSNHMHLLVEADGKRSLTRGAQGLAIRVARGLNRHWGRRGKVFAQRYFARFLRGANEIRRALRYVLQNARKHGIPLPPQTPDPYSSAPCYPWKDRSSKPPPRRASTRPHRFPETRQGLLEPLSLSELPGPRLWTHPLPL